MQTDDCEIKCVVGIDGAILGTSCIYSLATGNTMGIVKVYSINPI
jgi:hypothetical protein